jgi:hypothetical protein
MKMPTRTTTRTTTTTTTKQSLEPVELRSRLKIKKFINNDFAQESLKALLRTKYLIKQD